MAQRSFIDSNFTLVKREVRLYATISVAEAVTPVPTLLKWNYGTFGTGPNVRTYTAAPTGTVPSSAGNYPLQYQVGAEGVLSVTRTATGLYTLRLQDNYQRLVGMNAYAAVAGGTPVFAKLTENTTITNMGSPGGSLIGLAFWDFAAAAVDPIGTVRLSFNLQDATEA